MLCPHCNQEIPNDSLICSNCGKSLKADIPSEPRKNEEFVYHFAKESAPTEETPKQKNFLPLAIFLCVLAVLLVVGCAFCLLTAFHIIPDFFGLMETVESTPMPLSL